MLDIVRAKVENHPFKDLVDLREFIDKLFADLTKGRKEETIRAGKYHRASV